MFNFGTHHRTGQIGWGNRFDERILACLRFWTTLRWIGLPMWAGFRIILLSRPATCTNESQSPFSKATGQTPQAVALLSGPCDDLNIIAVLAHSICKDSLSSSC